MPQDLPSDGATKANQEDDEFVLIESAKLRSIPELQAWLKPTDYLSPGNEYMKHLHSYVPGTGDLIRNSEVYRDWLRTPTSSVSARPARCLWVKGVPGSGKSVLSASIAKELHNKGCVVLFFFFRQIVATNHDPKYLVRDWLAQLLPVSPWLHRHLDKLSKTRSDIAQDTSFLWDTLEQALRYISRTVYCIADGLDEMDDSYLDFLLKLKSLPAVNASFPAKVFLTSRPIVRIEEILRHGAVPTIKLDPTTLYPDIVRYVDVRLNALDPHLSRDKHQVVKDAICDRAKGLFLHARLMTDNLITGLQEGTIVEETLPTSLEKLPRNLKDLYTGMLAEHSSRSGISQEQQYTILQCVVHSTRPLRLIELGSLVMVLGRGVGMTLKEGKELVKRSCGRLLEILEDESVSVIHHSFTEFLHDGQRHQDPNAFPILNQDEAHEMLVKISLSYLSQCEVPSSVLYQTYIPEDDIIADSSDANPNLDDQDLDFDDVEYDDLDWSHERAAEDERKRSVIATLRLRYPLLDYVITNLSHHVISAVASTPSMFDMLDDCFVPDAPALNAWLLMQWKPYRPTKVSPLHVASSTGWSAYVRHLILRGVKIDEEDAERRTALSYAAEQGHDISAQILLEHGAAPDRKDRYGLGPMHYAAENGRIAVVKQLLAKNVSPVSPKSKTTPEWMLEQFGSDIGETPLQYACTAGHTEVVKLLLPNLDPEWRQKAFGWASNASTIEVVMQSGKVLVDCFDDLQTRLYRAAKRHDVELIKILLRHGADPRRRSAIKRNHLPESSEHWPLSEGDDCSDGPTPLHGWANYDHYSSMYPSEVTAVECFELLCNAGGDINATDGDGWTPLHCACRNRDDLFFGLGTRESNTLAMILLKAGARPNQRNQDGMTPLHLAASTDSIDCLVQYGADATIVDQKGRDALTVYLTNPLGEKKPDVVRKLIEISVARNRVGKCESTALHSLLGNLPEVSDLQVYRQVIATGLDVKAKDVRGRPALHLIQASNFEQKHGWLDKSDNRQRVEDIFTTLKDAGMNMNATDANGRTVLHELLRQHTGKLPVLNLLLDLGCSADVRDCDGATLLHHAVRNSSERLALIDLLVERGVDPLAVDRDSNNMMHTFILSSKDSFAQPLDVLQKLHHLGVPNDSQNRQGRTPLHLTCAISREIGPTKQWLEPFLNNVMFPTSDVNLPDRYGATPLHYAAVTSEVAVKLLLDAGADITAVTHEGLSPLHLAARARKPNTVGMLIAEYRKRNILEYHLQLPQRPWPGYTALYYACQSGRPESVRYLLDAGADPNRIDIHGGLALSVVASFKKRMVGTRSEQAGVRLRDCPGHGFRNERVLEIIDMLIRAGAGTTLDRPHSGDAVLAFRREEERHPADNAVAHGCIEAVAEFRRRGIIPRDTFSETLLVRHLDDAAVEMLLRVPNTALDNPARKRAGDADMATSFSMTASDKIQRVLELADYDLLRQLMRQDDELMLEGLYKLVAWGHAILLEEFLVGMHDVESKTRREHEYYKTLLTEACICPTPNLDVVRVLVEKADVDVNAIATKTGATALHLLARGDCFWKLEALMFLLSRGAEVNTADENGQTPLLCIAANPHGVWTERTMEILIENGAELNALDTKGKSVLNYAADARQVEIFVKGGASLLVGRTSPLVDATQMGRRDVVTALLKAGADPNQRNKDEKYALEIACSVEASSSTASSKSEEQASNIQALIEKGADPCAMYEDGSTVIQRLVEHHKSADLLLSSPKLRLESKGEGGRTVLISTCFPKKGEKTYHYSQKQAPVDSVLPTLAQSVIAMGADLTAKDDRGRTALHWLCSMQAKFDPACQELFDTLVAQAPSVIHVRDNSGWTPFHLALRSNQIWAIDRSLALGVNVHETDPDGNTALHILASWLFAEKATAEAVSTLLERVHELGVPIDARNKLGSTALAVFVAQSLRDENDPQQLGRLDDYDPEQCSNHSQYLDVFIKRGADIFAVNDCGEGLLHITACRTWGSKGPYRQQRSASYEEEVTATFEELLKRGLDPRLEDKECRTAIDVAVANGWRRIVALFREEK